MYRRQVFVAGAALAALTVRSVRAQALGTDCGVSFASGVLQLDPACVLAPTGSGMAVAPPAHLVAVSQAAEDGAGSPDAAAPQRGGRRQRIKARLRRRRHHAP